MTKKKRQDELFVETKDTDAAVEVHPLAALFPMLDDEDLNGLAEDIKTNGQTDPIVMRDGVLIDGRNRLAACKLAEIEPKFTEFTGTDDEAIAFIISKNTWRRSLSKGQQAMSVAMAYPEDAGHGGDRKSKAAKANGSTADSAIESGFSARRLRDARFILRHNRSLAEAVFNGAAKFEPALEKVRDEQKARETDVAVLDRLRAQAPDLAKRVDEGMDLDEAEAAREQRVAMLGIKIDAAIEVCKTFERLVALNMEPLKDAALVIKQNRKMVAADETVTAKIAKLEAAKKSLDPKRTRALFEERLALIKETQT